MSQKDQSDKTQERRNKEICVKATISFPKGLQNLIHKITSSETSKEVEAKLQLDDREIGTTVLNTGQEGSEEV